jgi:hypothetical protein
MSAYLIGEPTFWPTGGLVLLPLGGEPPARGVLWDRLAQRLAQNIRE